MSTSTLALTASQFRLEQKLFWRNRQAAIFNFALPIIFVVLFSLLFSGNGNVGSNAVPYTSYFVAGMIGVSLLSSTFANLAVSLVFQRDLLVLKRFRGTPLPASALFGAKILNSVVIVIIQVVIILTLGRLAFNTPLPQNPLAFVLIVITGIIVFAMAGIAFTAFIPNADSGPAVVQLPFLTLQFISGVFFPFTSEPAFLKTVANIFPLRWLLDAIRAGYLGFDYFHTKRIVTPASVGHAASVDQVPASVHGLHAITAAAPAYLNLAVWFVVFAFIARTRFRWEKRSS
jgi:ABC-2 type transport system permease protein